MALKPHSGTKRVGAVDHAERLVDHSILVEHVDVYPLSGNTSDKCYVGGPETVASAEQGYELDKTKDAAFTPPGPVDLRDIFIDVLTADDGVAYVYWTLA